MDKVVLFDRDGSLIVDPADERVTKIEKIKLFPDSITALQRLAANGYSIIMITNQAAIAEGRITEEDFGRINAEVVRQLEASGIVVHKTYMCPHGPNDNCDCRKPKPKMLLDAIEDFELEPARTFMVGDHDSDIQAAHAAGLRGIRVETANRLDPAPDADFTAASLSEAVDIILNN